MKRGFSFPNFIISIVLAMLLSLMIFGGVLAEGEEPPIVEPVAETTVITATQEDEPIPDDLQPVDTVVEPILEDGVEPVTTTEIIGEEAAESLVEPTVEGEIAVDLVALTAEAETVGIELVNDTGELIEMASQESADLLSGGDPYWYIGTTKYMSLPLAGVCPAGTLGTTCWLSANPIATALDKIDDGLLPTDRKLYVEYGTYNEDVTINGSDPILTQLTGLIGLANPSGLYPTIGGFVYVHDTTKGFTLSGFNIISSEGPSGIVRMINNTGPLVLSDLRVDNGTGPGIVVSGHTGAVTLSKVISTDNFGSGASIENVSAVFPVTVTHSEFNHNNDGGGTVTSNGLWIYSKGPVTLNYISGSTNDGRGLYVDTDKTLTIKNSTFNNNYGAPADPVRGYGVWVWTNYPTNHIILENVHADHNSASGFYIINGGNLSAKNIGAAYNAGSGAFFHSYGTASFTNTSFIDNGSDGLGVEANKNITVNNIIARLNGGFGVYLDTCLESGGVCQGLGSVSVSGSQPNEFIDNGSFGLQILASGAVSLTNFEASDNGQRGVYIRNSYDGISAGVTIKANYTPLFGTFTNVLHNNFSHGMVVSSNGTISVDKVLSLNNGGDGINLNNTSAITAKTLVLLNSEAWGNASSGFELYSLGSVTVTNCSAHDNSSSGLYINNSAGVGNITVGASTIKNMTGNPRSLEIYTKGIINIHHLDGSNSTFGAYLNNSSATSAKSVTVSDSIFSETINGSGLEVWSAGTITLKNIVANENKSKGVYIRNEYAATPQGIILNNIEAKDNQSIGIDIETLGHITAANIRSLGNGGDGFSANTCQYTGSECLGIGNVVISGTWNEFSGNASYGIFITSGGNVSISNFEVVHNTYGIYVYNNYIGESGSITFNAASGKYNSVRWNEANGILLASYGTLSLSRTISDDNSGYGASLSNENALTPKNVTVIDCSFSHNQNDGLKIHSKGTVTLKGVTIVGNSRYDTAIYSGNTAADYLSDEGYMYDGGMWESYWFWYSGGGNINIQLRSTEFIPLLYLYDENGYMLKWDANSGDLNDAYITAYTPPAVGNYRIEIASKDSGYGRYEVALNNPIGSITHSYLYTYGLYVDNTYGTGDVIIQPLGVKINKFNHNSYVGAEVYSNGNIVLASAEAHYNFYTGFSLANHGAPTPKNITITKTTANHNYRDGLNAFSLGVISWNSGGASDNRNSGSSLNNGGAVLPKTISVFNAVFDSNQTGLNIYSRGNITVSNVSACGNDDTWGHGLYIDTCAWSGGACTGIGSVTVSGKYGGKGYNENGHGGMSISAVGDIRVQNTEALSNGAAGAYLYNDYTNSVGAVFVTGTSASLSSFSENLGGDGFVINSRGSVTISYVRMEKNITGSGASIYNNAAVSPKPVSFNRVYANENNGMGIFVNSVGAITGTSIQATGNISVGAYFYNITAPSPQTITFSASEFSNNKDIGLKIFSTGKVTLNKVYADNNDSHGLYVVTTGDFLMLASQGENHFNRNGGAGIYIVNAFNVTLNKATANQSGWAGLLLSGNNNLTINTATFMHNTGQGISGTLSGNILISNALVMNNGTMGSDEDGILIYSSGGTDAKILNSIVTGNWGSGIQLSGFSTLTLTGTYYYGNDMDYDGQPNLIW